MADRRRTWWMAASVAAGLSIILSATAPATLGDVFSSQGGASGGSRGRTSHRTGAQAIALPWGPGDIFSNGSHPQKNPYGDRNRTRPTSRQAWWDWFEQPAYGEEPTPPRFSLLRGHRQQAEAWR